MLIACAFFWESRISICTRRTGFLHDQPPAKTLEPESQELPSLTAFHALSQFGAGGIKRVLCDSMGIGHLGVYAWFPVDCALCAFSLC